MQNCQKTRELTWNNCSGAFAASPGKRELAQAVLSRQGHLLQHQSTSPRPASCPYIQANHHGAPQKDLAMQRGLEEHPRGRDPAVLQAQAPTSPGPSAQQRPWSAGALVPPESLWGWWERWVKSSIQQPVGPHSRVCFQHILPRCILAPGTAPGVSCHFTALQLLMFISEPSANLPEHSSSFDPCSICVWFQHHSDVLVSG